MMKKCILSLILSICGFQIVFSQSTVKDSLLAQLTNAKQDTNLVGLYFSIGEQYEVNDPETAAFYYLKAHDLSERLKYRRGLIRFATYYTYILNLQGKKDSSLILNKQSLRLALDMNDTSLIAKCYANTGSSFQYMDVYDSAIAYYHNARRYAEKVQDARLAAQLSGIMLNVYHSMRQYEKAVQLGEFALAYFRQHPDSVQLGIILSNLGNSYSRLGQFDKSRAVYQEALLIAQNLDFVTLRETLLLNLADLSLKEMKIDQFKKYIDEALVVAQKNNSPDALSKTYRGLGMYSLFKKDFPTARRHIEHALSIDSQHNLRAERAANLEQMSFISFALHEIELGEKYGREAAALRDSLLNDELTRRVVITEQLFERQKKEDQIHLQRAAIRQKNLVNYIFGGGILAAFAILILSFRSYSQKKKLQQQKITELETEKQLAATEAVLKGEEQERTRLARDLHDGLGGILSGIKFSFQTMKENLIMSPENQHSFERSMDMLDSSIREMRRVAHNMMPEALLKFGLDAALKDFCSSISQSGVLNITYQSDGLEGATIDQTKSIAIYRIIQELVNNVLKHAAASSAIVQVNYTQDAVTITVEDNGKGFNVSDLKEIKGIGWKNVISRVEFLRGTIDVKSSPGEGTSTFIEFKA